jgi:uncharacterized membrane protein
MYKIIGADQKEYGPIDADQMRRWIAEGRVGAQTSVQAEGGEWRPLQTFPEFAEALAAKGVSSAAAPGTATARLPADVLERDYNLDIGGCISGGWNLLTNNFGMLFCGALIYFGIEMGIALLGAIPLIGPLFSLANLFVMGPLLGGLYYLSLQTIRRQSATAGDVFAGFRAAYLQLFLGQLVAGLLAGLCMIPAVIAGVITILPSVMHHRPPGVPQIVIVGLVALVCMIPMIFLQVNWKFTLPLIIDRQMNFWPAMQASWKMVGKHWWQVFGLLVIVGLINVAGVLVCCVGVLFTMPIGIAATMYAYETIFSAATPQTR